MSSNIAIIVIFIFPLSLHGNIDKYFNYYETLHHDSFRHHIARRDLYTANPSERLVEFDSHGRHFKLVLHKEKSLLTEDFVVTVVNEDGIKSMKFDPAMYQGYLEDEPETSSVTAYWDDDADEFTATISTESDVYAIEPSWRYLPESVGYNLISYRASDMKPDENSKHQTCATTEKNIKNDMGDRGPRNKRSDESSNSEFPHKVCTVRLVADYRFHQKIGKSDRSKTARYLMGLMNWIDHLYQGQPFSECGQGFGFQIGDITIHESPSAKKDEFHYNRVNTYSSSEGLLAAFTYTDAVNNSKYCLVHLFTATGFKSNVFGIAYVADSKNRSSGICSEYKKPVSHSFNTGWTSFLDRNDDLISTMQAQLVVAHEFGHGWGSHHDPTNSSTCAPSDAHGGKYLMFTSSVNGIQQNNKNFSSCSKKAICEVLKTRAHVCFSDRSNCKNYIRDANERCDEGPVSLNQKCCTEKCELKDKAVCSDMNDICCENCQFADSSKICHIPDDKSCTATTNCSGNSSNCPDLEILADGADCKTENGARGTCKSGVCISLCQTFGLIPCLCDSENSSCKVCCRNSTVSGSCQEFYNGTSQVNTTNNTPCPIGICVDGVCQRLTDATLLRPWNFITFESVAGFVKFMKNNIVGSVIIISLLLWIPASCAVSYIDRKRSRKGSRTEFEADWQATIMSHLISPSVQSLTKIKMTEGTIDRRRTEKKERLYK